MSDSADDTTPQPEIIPMSDEERRERLRRFAERFRDPDGFDDETLARLEQLTGEAP